MHSNQNLKSLYFLVNQVKDFQAARREKKILSRNHDKYEDSIPYPSQYKPLNLYDKLPCCGKNLHHQ